MVMAAYMPGALPQAACRLNAPVLSDPTCRELLGSEELDWHAVAEHFKRSVQAVRSKCRHEQVGCLTSMCSPLLLSLCRAACL